MNRRLKGSGSGDAYYAVSTAEDSRGRYDSDDAAEVDRVIDARLVEARRRIDLAASERHIAEGAAEPADSV